MELFGTAGIRGDVRTEVTPSLALAVGQAAAADGDAFVVGRDGRETGPALVAAVEAGLESGGADVTRLGQVPTPTLAYASQGRQGIMVTASHNPPHDNGLKLFVDGSEYDREAEQAIKSRINAATEPTDWESWGHSTSEDVLDDYREAVARFTHETVDDCQGLHVAVDCGNGMASLATPQVLRQLGASVVTLNANIDGHFPGRESKPTPESLETLRAFVADGEFDLGIGHDGDADRIVIVDENGGIVHEDTILAIIAGVYVRASDAADPVVVTTPNASARIDDHVETSGGRVERVRLGALHEGIDRVQHPKRDDATVVFAAEPWKHVHTAFGPWIDAVASSAVFGALVARDGLDSLRAPITERPYRKVSVDCPDERKPDVMSLVETRLSKAFPETDVDTEYGVRLTFEDAAWVLVRPSGTEPYVRVYAESDDVDTLVEDVVAVVERAVADAA
jgi:phosphomannomutase